MHQRMESGLVTTGNFDHGAIVDAWLERVAQLQDSEPLLRAFEQGFAAMWRGASRTLGDVTLAAIVDRVIYNAAERFPEFSALTVEANGLSCKALLSPSVTLQRDALLEGIRFVLVEFLTVLGNLTAEVLAPRLHDELSKIGPARGAGPANAMPMPNTPDERAVRDPDDHDRGQDGTHE